MANRRSEARKERRRAGSETRDAKHRAGGDWSTLKIPDGLQLFQPKEGTYRMDIVPYEVGKGNPYAKEGEWYYERTYFIHARVGANNESYVCPNKTAKLPCPICEHRANLSRDPDGDEKLIKDLKPKERQLFLVHVLGDDDGAPVRLYESSFHTFGKLLDKRRQDAEEDEPHIAHFDDHEAGSTLKVAYQDNDAGGYSFVDCYSIDFKQRAKGLDEDLLTHGFCLDDMVVIPSYDELKKKFFQEPETNDDEDDEDEDDDVPAPKKSVKKTSKPPVDDDDEDPDIKTVDELGLEVGMTVRHRTEGECTIVRISGDGTSLVLENEDGEKVRAVNPNEVKPIQQKKEEKPSSGPRSKKATKPIKEEKPSAEDDDDDDWDDDDDPAPAKTKRAPTKQAKKSDDDDWD